VNGLALEVGVVVDSVDLLVCGLDDDGAIRLFNRTCERITGMPRATAIGQRWLGVFGADDRGEHVRSLWSRIHATRAVEPFEARCRAGRHLRWYFTPQGDHRLPAIHLWAVGIDVTNEGDSRARAREGDQMVMMGNLMSGLTHELRNPLNGALLQIALAQRIHGRDHDRTPRDDHDDALGQALAQSAAELKRVATVLDDFLVLVRPQPLVTELASAAVLAARAIARCRPRAAAAAVTVAIAKAPDVYAELDVARVEAALVQLIANAIDAAAIAPARDVVVRWLATNTALRFEIEDAGTGPLTEAPIFEPFFSTKDGGTGLGLAIAQRVATDHGGVVRYERRGDRTVFAIDFPLPTPTS